MSNLPTTSLSFNQLFEASRNIVALHEQLGDPQLIAEGELIFDQISEKIDSIHYVKCVFEDALSGVDARLKRLQELRDNIASNLKRIENGVLYTMQKFGADKVPGNEVKARLQYTETVVPACPTPQLSDCALWPQFVRTKYEWDKTAIKDAHKAGKDIGAVAEVKRNAHVRWDVVSSLKSKDKSLATNLGG